MARLAFLALLLCATPSVAATPREGFLQYDVRDAATHQPVPCKLTFLGDKGTPTPAFTRRDIGRQEGDAIAAFNRLMSATGQGEIALPIGTYTVWVSRGPEWDAQVIRGLRIGAAPATIKTTLSHVVDTRGWLSGDFHVHAAPSPDSMVPLQDRVYEFVADGVELIVSSDHNVVTDYEPVIRELRVGTYLASMAGDELTTNGWGHFGAFPLPHDLERAGQGAILVHGRDAADFFADVRRVAPLAVIDVHHPRIDADIGYFNLSRYDSHADRAARPGFSIDFDALEVLNGYQDAERRHVDRVIEDWFALLDHGHLVTATGNSDSHHLDYNIGGYPRNYIQLRNDAPSALRPDDVARAVRGHHSFFTTAPFVRLRAGDGTIGDLVPAKDGKASLEVEVQAAPWVTVTTVTIFVDGRQQETLKVPPSKAPLRLRTTVPLSFKRDAYVVARVDGDAPLAPIVGDDKRFDVRPFALTNPIFFDVDGNGRFDAVFASPPRRGAVAPTQGAKR